MINFDFLHSEGFANAYECFNKHFGWRTHGNGVTSRKNKVVLNHLKNKELLRYVRERCAPRLLAHDISTLKRRLLFEVQSQSRKGTYSLELMGMLFGSNEYKTDEYEGLCVDADKKSVRYVKAGRVHKMRAGKLFRKILESTEIGRILNEETKVWICEEFANDWQAYATAKLPAFELRVNDDFESLYSSSCCSGDMNSCMTDKDLHGFYENSVDASAAALVNEEGLIVARCVIYNDVRDQTGRLWRLAERQYSVDMDIVLQRALIEKLIQGGYIDGYKKVGAGCSESNAFVDNKGNDLSDHRFQIKCVLDFQDELSYQDSFKWYDIESNTAYNYDSAYYTHTLDRIEGEIEETREWDEYHEEYCREVHVVHYRGQEITCSEERLDDFIWVNSCHGYHHYDDCERCCQCGEWYVTEDYGYYSELTGGDYCSYDCQLEGEEEYRKDNMYYSEYDDEWYEHEDEVIDYFAYSYTQGRYVKSTISVDSLNNLIEDCSILKTDHGYFYSSDELLKMYYEIS